MQNELILTVTDAAGAEVAPPAAAKAAGTAAGVQKVVLTDADGAPGAGSVTDTFLSLAGVGQKTAGASAAVTTGMTGAGYLTILNTDPSAAAYLGTGTVDNTKFLLPAGASITWPIANVTTVHCYSAGTPVLSWAFLQVP